MTGGPRFENDGICPRCGQAMIPCYAASHDGLPVKGRYYCQRDALEVVFLPRGRVIEVPTPSAPTRRGWAGALANAKRLLGL